MAQNFKASSMMVISCCVVIIILSYGASFAQDVPENLEHKPANIDVLAAFMNKLGYKKYKLIREKELHGIIFVVRDNKSTEIIKFSVMFNPNDLVLKIECHDLAEVPSSPEKRDALLQRLTELNGTRTIGKYYINGANKEVQYFYFRTVVGGICYADFQRTLRLIQFIVLKDLKILRDLTS